MITMTRIIRLACVAGLFAAGANAQEPQDSQTVSTTSCPRGAVSIYFASGDATASPQAQALIGKIGETATSCQPDRVDLVARIDVTTDGDKAVAVALERLGNVAADLVSHGLSPDRIRVAALSAVNLQGPRLNQIDVLFSKDNQPADEVPPPSPPPQYTSRDAI